MRIGQNSFAFSKIRNLGVCCASTADADLSVHCQFRRDMGVGTHPTVSDKSAYCALSIRVSYGCGLTEFFHRGFIL